MNRFAAPNEMYHVHGNLSDLALWDLYKKIYNLVLSYKNSKLEPEIFCQDPLFFAKLAANKININTFDSDIGEQKAFIGCLRILTKEWENSEKSASIRGVSENAFDKFTDNEIIWNTSSKKDAYYKNHTTSGYNWLDIDWHFPDSVIMEVLNVTRQVANYHRKQFEKQYIRNACNKQNEFSHNRLLKNEQTAKIINSNLVVIDAIDHLPIESAAKVLKNLPDISTPRNNLSTIETISRQKGLSESEICRHLLAAFPNVVEITENLLEDKTNIPNGFLSEIRELNPDWIGQFENIPNIHKPNKNHDPLIGLEDSKGMKREEVCPLLWKEYAPALEEQPDLPRMGM